MALLRLEARPSAPELSILFLRIVRLKSGVFLDNRSVRSNPVGDAGCVQEVALTRECNLADWRVVMSCSASAQFILVERNHLPHIVVGQSFCLRSGARTFVPGWAGSTLVQINGLQSKLTRSLVVCLEEVTSYSHVLRAMG